ncbi:MAG: effector-associated domain EAD1-containing protein [Dolichospermum sp.]|jgi:hypothetical protein|nr:effector-associated domain EAD1-containing protein [Anabaena sp. 49628_E55]
MKLSGVEYQKLVESIVQAYPTKDDLAQIVMYSLEENIDAIVNSETTTQSIVFNLILWVQARGKLKNLLEIVSQERPDNVELQETIKNLLAKINNANNTSNTNTLQDNQLFQIQSIYCDPEDYIGAIWTHIIPEKENINKEHLITIDWGAYRWQQEKNVPEKGLLLCYLKRNKDFFARLTTVSIIVPKTMNSINYISNETKIIDGYGKDIPSCLQLDINDGWVRREFNFNLINISSMFAMFDKFKSLIDLINI